MLKVRKNLAPPFPAEDHANHNLASWEFSGIESSSIRSSPWKYDQSRQSSHHEFSFETMIQGHFDTAQHKTKANSE